MSIIYPTDAWYPCDSNPRCSDIILGDILILYSYLSLIDGTYKLETIKGRWNGLEWRTDDFGGLTDKDNIFDDPSNVPLLWKVIPNILTPEMKD